MTTDHEAHTDRELVAGTLRGYRSWHLLHGAHGGAIAPASALPLTSITRHQVVWDVEMTATCTPAGDGRAVAAEADVPVAEHQAPETECSCGIYAWYDPVDVAQYGAEIFGVVEASGLVLMATRGFRAERARIDALVTRNRRLARACREAGVTVYRSRRKLLADHPPDDVGFLVGEPPTRPRRRGPRAFGLVVAISVVVRAAAIACAATAVPAAIVMGALLLSEVALLTLVVRSVRP